MSHKTRVLILCTGNSARSQMAEGLLRHDHGERFEVESAGKKPGSVRPEAIAVMREIDIDISGHIRSTSKNLEHNNSTMLLLFATMPAKHAQCTLAKRESCI